MSKRLQNAFSLLLGISLVSQNLPAMLVTRDASHNSPGTQRTLFDSAALAVPFSFTPGHAAIRVRQKAQTLVKRQRPGKANIVLDHYEYHLLQKTVSARSAVRVSQLPLFRDVFKNAPEMADAWRLFAESAVYAIVWPEGPTGTIAALEAQLRASIGDSGLIDRLLQDYYAEILQQFLTYALRAQKVTLRDDVIEDTLRFLENAIPRERAEQIFTSIQFDALAAMQRPFKFNDYGDHRTHPLQYQTPSGAFTVMKYLLQHHPPTEEALLEKAFTEFILAAADINDTMRIYSVKEIQKQFEAQGRKNRLMHIYAGVLPKLYERDYGHRSPRVESKRKLAHYVDSTIRHHLTEDEADSLLHDAYQQALPHLIAELEDPRRVRDDDLADSVNFFHWMMHKTNMLDLSFLRRAHRALTLHLDVTDDRTLNFIRNALTGIETRADDSKSKEQFAKNYADVVPELLNIVYGKSIYYDDGKAIEQAVTGLHVVQHFYASHVVPGGEEKWQELLLHHLPKLMRSMAQRDTKCEALKDLADALEATSSIEEWRSILQMHLPAWEMFVKYPGSEGARWVYGPVVVARILPKSLTSPYLEVLQVTEQFLLSKELLEVALHPEKKEPEKVFEEFYHVLAANEYWDSSNPYEMNDAERFSKVAHVIGFANTFTLSYGKEWRSSPILRTLVKDFVPLVQARPEYGQSLEFFQEIRRYKALTELGQLENESMIGLLNFVKRRSDNYSLQEIIYSLRTINEILEQVRRPQPQTTAIDQMNDGNVQQIADFLVSSDLNSHRLRAIFDIYFNSDDQESAKHIDRYDMRFAAKNPGAFHNSMPDHFRIIHRQQDRKLDYGFFVPFMKMFIDAETGTLAPEAEFFFKLLTSRKLHRYRSLKIRLIGVTNFLNAHPGSRTVELFRDGLRFIDKRDRLGSIASKSLDNPVVVGPGASEYLSFQMARDFTSLADLANDLLTLEEAEKNWSERNPALEWSVRLAKQLESILSESNPDSKTFARFTNAVRQFRYFYRSQKLKILYTLFQTHVHEPENTLIENLQTLAEYADHIAVNQDGKTVVDSAVEYVQSNIQYPEVIQNMHDALLQEAKGTFKPWRYQSADYRGIIQEWKNRHPGTENVEAAKKIQREWEKNRYYSVNNGADAGLIVGFTDNFPTLLNLGNPSYFGSCQATYKPAYNRGLGGTMSNGWNKAIVIYDKNHNFIARRIVRLRITSNGELVLLREGTYGQNRYDAWMDQLLAKVAYDMGLRYQPDHAETVSTLLVPLNLAGPGNSEWDYSDAYGPQFENPAGLVRTTDGKELVPKLHVPLQESWQAEMDSIFSETEESIFKLFADHMVERNPAEKPTADFRTSYPLERFIQKGGEWYFQGAQLFRQVMDHFVSGTFDVLEQAIISPLGKISIGLHRKENRLYYLPARAA